MIIMLSLFLMGVWEFWGRENMAYEEIREWVDTGKAFDKAGAYAIQEEFAKFIDKIDGNYFSVVGLPIDKVYDVVKNFIN